MLLPIDDHDELKEIRRIAWDDLHNETTAFARHSAAKLLLTLRNIRRSPQHEDSDQEEQAAGAPVPIFRVQRAQA
jgi:hypothetical protein